MAPTPHSIIHPTAAGDYELRGHRSYDGSALFDLHLDGEAIFVNASWPKAWPLMQERFRDNRVDGMLRDALAAGSIRCPSCGKDWSCFCGNDPCTFAGALCDDCQLAHLDAVAEDAPQEPVCPS